MTKDVSQSVLACLLLFLAANGLSAFDFRPIKDTVIGAPGARSQFPSNVRVTGTAGESSIDTYKFVDPEVTSLRTLARTYTWGMGSNHFACIDLRTSSIVWEWYLDSPVIQVLQTNEGAFALTFRSLYAIDLRSGKPRWQVDTKSGEFRDSISMANAEQSIQLTQSEEPIYLHRMGIDALSFLAYNAAADELVLSLQDNSLLAIRTNGSISARQKHFEEAGRPGTIDSVKCVFSVRDAVYVFYADRLLRRMGRGLGVTNHIYFPETSIKGVGEFAAQVLIVGGGKALVYSWDLNTSALRAADDKLPEVSLVAKTDDGDFLVSTIKGLINIDRGSLEESWTFRGAKMTIWIAIVPVNLRQLSWQVWSFIEEGRRRKVLLSGNDLVVLDAHSGTELSRTRLPISLSSNGMLRMAAILFDSVTVPPYIDRRQRRMYLPVTELGGKVSQALDDLRVKNHIVEISW